LSDVAKGAMTLQTAPNVAPKASRSSVASHVNECIEGLMPSRNLTELLVAWSQGDRRALEALTPLVQRELHRLARRYMASERPDHTLNATALVNEAYVRLIEQDADWQNRAHFFGVAAQTMRHILVDMARARRSAKRGGGQFAVTLSDAADVPVVKSGDLVALDDAMKSLEAFDARKCRVVEMRFFAGLNLDEIASVLEVSVTTVRRDWSLARAWLHRELSRGN
jgi:RNA polymerase sigma factor (TIGR02999 family)